MGFLKRAFDFVVRPTHSRTMGILVILVLVSAVSLTIIVAQKQQTLKQHASETQTNCSVTFDWTNYIKYDGLKEGAPYTATLLPSSGTSPITTTDANVTFSNVASGQYYHVSVCDSKSTGSACYIHPGIIEPSCCTCPSDNNECTVDACIGGVCQHTPKASGTTCTDEAFNPGTCTSAGICDTTTGMTIAPLQFTTTNNGTLFYTSATGATACYLAIVNKSNPTGQGNYAGGSKETAKMDQSGEITFSKYYTFPTGTESPQTLYAVCTDKDNIDKSGGTIEFSFSSPTVTKICAEYSKLFPSGQFTYACQAACTNGWTEAEGGSTITDCNNSSTPKCCYKSNSASPTTCSGATSCTACTTMSGCGWSGDPNGAGNCEEGSSMLCPANHSSWYWRTTDCTTPLNLCPAIPTAVPTVIPTIVPTTIPTTCVTLGGRYSGSAGTFDCCSGLTKCTNTGTCETSCSTVGCLGQGQSYLSSTGNLPCCTNANLMQCVSMGSTCQTIDTCNAIGVTLGLGLDAQDVSDQVLASDSTITLSLRDSSGNVPTNNVGVGSPTLAFTNSISSGKRYFRSNSIKLVNANATQGQYLIFARNSNNMIAKSLFSLGIGQTAATARDTTFVFGDLDNNNDINTTDFWGVFRNCWNNYRASGYITPDTCRQSDFDQSGTIDQVDYNIFLRGFATWNKEGKNL